MGQGISAFWDQSFFLKDPTFTEKDLPDQTGKVVIITGGYTGIGLELAKLLYPKNATVYIAGRSASKAETAISALTSQFPHAKGRLAFLPLDLADLSTIKASVDDFLSKEERLDVLINNAGVMVPPAGSRTPQGHDLTLGTNIYGPWLFTELLHPVLKQTVGKAETGSVRVSWAASLAVDLMAPKGGVLLDAEGKVKEGNMIEQTYGVSKAANVLLGVESARRWGKDGIVTNSFNPGNLQSELQRHTKGVMQLVAAALCYPVHYGAWTELFAGWSPEITPEKSGCYVLPWGRVGRYNTSLQNAAKRKEEGGEGKAEMLWEACEKVCKEYM